MFHNNNNMIHVSILNTYFKAEIVFYYYIGTKLCVYKIFVKAM